ncbi:MAG: adenosylmethionine--8-amino-7-oxononanoate transaminase [Mariprofundaceae bacterium]|nr:adenosylmethionine--8-amino-7-oxononanoate transaminase [Mariprofundaceae bacterium]
MSDKDFEQQHLWHPYASMQTPAPVYHVESAQGVRLNLLGGREVIDGMASWWCAIHGYNVPALNQAAAKQLNSMAHVMFGGLTHQPAIDLAKTLLQIAPSNMQHVFFADSGSVAVEVSLKMAIQYWKGRKQPQKSKFLSLKHAYHGDTFGAMAVCDPISGMHHVFSDVLAEHIFSQVNATALRQAFELHHQHLAALIIEPMVQGAGGMHFYPAELLQTMRTLCDEFDVLLIADEIATGFGRTGKLFACEHANIQPDILCVGKALTGGYMSLAAVLSDAEISAGIHAQGDVLMHGPTFMANPLACAVAKASLDLLLASPWQSRVRHIQSQLEAGLAPCKDMPHVADVRVLGAIGVLEMKHNLDVAQVQSRLLEQGIWLRPFGKLLYTMPAFVMDDADLRQLTDAMVDAARRACVL